MPIASKGSNYRCESLLYENSKEPYINFIVQNIAYPSIIYIAHLALHGRNYSGIGTAKAHGVTLFRLQFCDNVFAYPARISHCDNLDSFFIGYPSALNHSGFDAELFAQFCGELPSAMN